MSSIDILNYFPIDVEASIYAMEVLKFEDGSSTALAGSRDGHVFCVNHRDERPHVRKMQFSYIPSESQIMSIRALKQGFDEFVIGITHYHHSNTFPSRDDVNLDDNRSSYPRQDMVYYLNIYASVKNDAGEYDLDSVAQSCQTINLKYCPSVLFPCDALSIISSDDMTKVHREPVWLVAGGDRIVHTFVEDKLCHSFGEINADQAGFPELSTSLEGIATWMDLKYVDKTKDESRIIRLTCFGMDDGTVMVFQSSFNVNSGLIEKHKTLSWTDATTIVTSVRFFKIRSTYDSKLRKRLVTKDEDFESEESKINLLVVHATGQSFIFSDILSKGLHEVSQLVGSERIDVNTTSAIADINYDGLNEILIGNYNRELMIFQYDQENRSYYFEDLRIFKQPVFSIHILDFTKNAVNDILLLISDGVLLLQSKVEDLLSTVDRRLQLICDSRTNFNLNMSKHNEK